MFVISTERSQANKRRTHKNFSHICDWFVDNRLSINFREDKTKSILFSTKERKMKVEALDKNYGKIKIKQHSNVTYSGCKLDKNLSGEAMALKFINKGNNKMQFQAIYCY